MFIPEIIVMFINPILILWLLVEVYFGFKNGLVIQILNMIGTFVAMLIAWLLTPVFAQVYQFFKSSGVGLFTIEQTITAQLNFWAWFVILVIVIKVLLFIITPMVKWITNVPLIKQVNSLAGGILSVFMYLLKVMIVCFFLTIPIFKNGIEVIDNSYLSKILIISKPFERVFNTTIETNLGLQSILNDRKLSDEQTQAMVNWLENNGFNQYEIEGYLRRYE